jgi:hypothetical protein
VAGERSDRFPPIVIDKARLVIVRPKVVMKLPVGHGEEQILPFGADLVGLVGVPSLEATVVARLAQYRRISSCRRSRNHHRIDRRE